MPVRSKLSPADRLFGALANPTRRDILDLLLGGEQTAGAIAARFAMSRPSVSEHLRVLLDAGLVSERSDGRHVVYAPAPEPLLAVRDWLAPHERFWRERLKHMRGVLDALPDDIAPDAGPREIDVRKVDAHEVHLQDINMPDDAQLRYARSADRTDRARPGRPQPDHAPSRSLREDESR
jgi:DNA-binding transcriptional ArsR family regulator